MVAGFERNVALEECLLSFTPMCDVISAVTEFMVRALHTRGVPFEFHADVGVEAQSYV